MSVWTIVLRWSWAIVHTPFRILRIAHVVKSLVLHHWTRICVYSIFRDGGHQVGRTRWIARRWNAPQMPTSITRNKYMGSGPCILSCASCHCNVHPPTVWYEMTVRPFWYLTRAASTICGEKIISQCQGLHHTAFEPYWGRVDKLGPCLMLLSPTSHVCSLTAYNDSLNGDIFV